MNAPREHEEPHAPPQRVLALADSVGATQYIFFEQPLRPAVAAGALALTMARDDPAWDEADARESLWCRHRPTVLVLSRYSNARALAFVDDARRRGVPVLFHIDDDLLDVPLALGSSKYNHYHQPERLAALRRALNSADLVFASTEPLARRLREHGIAAPVVAGADTCAVDASAFPQPLPALGPVIGYMGTGGHSQDLAMVMPTLVRLLHEIPDLRFETFGTIRPPVEMVAFEGRYLHHAGVADYESFVSHLCGLGWWVGIAPLADNPFNRCKIDTKWVEYTYAGIAVVATDLPVYERACVAGAGMRATSAEAWHAALGDLLRDGNLRQAQVRRARQHLQQRHAELARRQPILRILDEVTRRARLAPAPG